MALPSLGASEPSVSSWLIGQGAVGKASPSQKPQPGSHLHPSHSEAFGVRACVYTCWELEMAAGGRWRLSRTCYQEDGAGGTQRVECSVGLGKLWGPGSPCPGTRGCSLCPFARRARQQPVEVSRLGQPVPGKSREQLSPRGRESACPVGVGGAGPPSATSRDPSWPTFSQAPLKPPLF